MECTLRLWDSYVAETHFASFHVYVCAAVLLHFSSTLKATPPPPPPPPPSTLPPHLLLPSTSRTLSNVSAPVPSPPSLPSPLLR